MIALDNIHLFSNPAFLRRELCDRDLLRRDKYGKQYWKTTPVTSTDKSGLEYNLPYLFHSPSKPYSKNYPLYRLS